MSLSMACLRAILTEVVIVTGHQGLDRCAPAMHALPTPCSILLTNHLQSKGNTLVKVDNCA